MSLAVALNTHTDRHTHIHTHTHTHTQKKKNFVLSNFEHTGVRFRRRMKCMRWSADYIITINIHTLWQFREVAR